MPMRRASIRETHAYGWPVDSASVMSLSTAGRRSFTGPIDLAARSRSLQYRSLHPRSLHLCLYSFCAHRLHCFTLHSLAAESDGVGTLQLQILRSYF